MFVDRPADHRSLIEVCSLGLSGIFGLLFGESNDLLYPRYEFSAYKQFVAGYYSRYAIIRSLLLDFISKVQAHRPDCQIISLGAGYDTTYFQLKSENALSESVKYIEVDFKEVVDQKTALIVNQPTLLKYVQPSGDSVKQPDTKHDLPHAGMISPSYCLVSADLRSTEELGRALSAAHWNPSLPTFVLLECVLVYMDSKNAFNILEWLAQPLQTAACVIYDPINPNDAFGKQMMVNLQSRGSPLLGILPSKEAQIERLLQSGWTTAQSMQMSDVYRTSIPIEERRRTERLEIFDEFEEWNLIQQHYCIALGLKDDSGILQDYAIPDGHEQKLPQQFPVGSEKFKDACRDIHIS